ncbi:MAG TPA: 1,2-phenylacetyl-CoA epoxidase subunit PaaC [Conexibacter sp.]|nr:1,2-phenylacetyl-CoA epoxidase subunit PaaC [Conexibacter sp.]
MSVAAAATEQTWVYALRLGDDALVLAQRLGEWSASAPELEEDMALSNIALDLLGQARTLLTRAGELEGAGRDEDALAYLRNEREFLNVLLVEQDNGDFAQTIVRQLLFSAYQHELYGALRASTDPVLAGVAGKAVKEVAYHRDHALTWTLRLGDGTDESRARMQRALERLWPYAGELFEADALTDRLAADGVAVDPAALRPAWEAFVLDALARATLTLPQDDWHPTGGRAGRHEEALGLLLAELQHVHRSHPGATW